MSQQIQCPHCGQSYALTDEQVPQYAGQTITCTRCQKPFTVPPASVVAASVVAAPTVAATSMPTAGIAPQVTSPFPPQQPSGSLNYGLRGNYMPQQTSGLAIASLVSSIIGMLIFPASVIGIVLGIIALTKTKDPQVGGKGLAIGGIAVGAVGILEGIVLASCVYSTIIPSMGIAREAANRVKCAANLRQIGQALLLYANDNSGAYPPRLEVLLTTEDITPEVFICPDASDTPAPGATAQQQAAAVSNGGHASYVYVGANLTNRAAANTVIAYEPLADHANAGSNILWRDGHVSFERNTQAKRIIDQVSAGQNPPTLPPTRTRGSQF